MEKKDELRNLPPTRATFYEGVKRAHYQFIIWKSAPDINPDKPMPDNYGWKRDYDMSPLDPEAPLQLIKWVCSMSVFETSRCKCKANQLYCTDLY